jgi:hypothetical protein
LSGRQPLHQRFSELSWVQGKRHIQIWRLRFCLEPSQFVLVHVALHLLSTPDPRSQKTNIRIASKSCRLDPAIKPTFIRHAIDQPRLVLFPIAVYFLEALGSRPVVTRRFPTSNTSRICSPTTVFPLCKATTVRRFL